MTDPSFDELASAHLDGATTPEEAARVAADPALRARVEELRAVREAVAAPVPVDEARREAAIAAALDAFTEVEDAPATPSVTPLRSVAPRRGPNPTVVRVLGAAAVIALLALLVPVLGRLGQSSDDDAAEFSSTGAAIESGDEADRLESAAEDDDGADATTSTTSALVADLGDFDDVAALLDDLGVDASSPLFGSGEGSMATGGRPAGCPAPDAPAASVQTTRAEVATATVDGDAVEVVVQQTSGAPSTVFVYRVADCELLALRGL